MVQVLESPSTPFREIHVHQDFLFYKPNAVIPSTPFREIHANAIAPPNIKPAGRDPSTPFREIHYNT